MSNNRETKEDFLELKRALTELWKSRTLRNLRSSDKTPDTRVVPGASARTKEYLNDAEIVDLQRSLNYYKKALSRHRKERDKTLPKETK